MSHRRFSLPSLAGKWPIVEFVPEVESTEIVEIDDVTKGSGLVGERDGAKRAGGGGICVSDLLRAPWWQGVAGLAQIIAAILAVWTIRQARKTILLADEERKLSVRPDWDLMENKLPFGPPRAAAGQDFMPVRLEFSNTGFGPARQLRIHFQSTNGNEPFGLGCNVGPMGTILANGRLQVSFTVNQGEPLDGQLVIESTSRFDEQVSCRFLVQTEDVRDGMGKPTVKRIGCD